MANFERSAYLPNLRFLTPLFEKPHAAAEAQQIWMGDVFAYDGGAFCVPPAEGARLTTDYHERHSYWDITGAPCVDYDFASARHLINAAAFTQRATKERLKNPKPTISIKHTLFLVNPSPFLLRSKIICFWRAMLGNFILIAILEEAKKYARQSKAKGTRSRTSSIAARFLLLPMVTKDQPILFVKKEGGEQ